MTMDDAPTFQYLHRHGEWPGFAFSGVEVLADGSLALARLPLFDGSAGEGATVPGLEGPAGVSVDDCGNIWVADARLHRILRVDGCDGSVSVLGCLRGPGRGAGELWSPHGVLVGPRDALYVADTGNRRVLVVDRVAAQLRGVLGAPADEEGDLARPGTFAEPWDLAADARGRIYVADPGWLGDDGVRRGGRVQRFAADGRVDASFAERLAAHTGEGRLRAPIGVATIVLDPADARSERLLVLEREPARLLVYTPGGDYDAATTALWERAMGRAGRPAAVAERDGAIYVADATGGRLVSFGTSGDFRGVRRVAAAGAAGLAFDCRGRLVLHVGGAGSVQQALGGPGHAECGTFVAGPFTAPSLPTRWQRLEVGADPLPAGSHLYLYTLTSDTLDGSPGNAPTPPATCTPPDPVAVQAATVWDPAPLDSWRAAPADATDFLCLNVPGRYLWIAGRLEGDGTASPVIRQIQLNFDQAGWLQHLPAMYTRNPVAQRFLERFLALFEGVLDAEDDLLRQLPEYLDARAAPDAAPRPTWLEWLAGWVDARLDETASADERREIVAIAFREHGRRGTASSLRRLVARATGATPVIGELGIPGPWALGEAPLGVESALAPAAPQPAVVDRTAIVDASALLRDEDIGAAAYEPWAHRFTVSVPAHQLRRRITLAHVGLVVDREKPAHATYSLCAIEARARVGVAARVGVDAIVAGPPPPARLGETSRIGDGALADGALADGPSPSPPRVGVATAT
jgi:phage tail-like protein